MLQTNHFHAASTVPGKLWSVHVENQKLIQNCGGEIPQQKQLSYLKEIICVTNWTRNILGLHNKCPIATSNCQVRMELYIMKHHSRRLGRGYEDPLIINPRSIEVTGQLHAPDLSPGPVARYSLDSRLSESRTCLHVMSKRTISEIDAQLSILYCSHHTILPMPQQNIQNVQEETILIGQFIGRTTGRPA